MYMERMDLRACVLLWIICFNVSRGITFNTTATMDTKSVATPSPTPLTASTAGTNITHQEHLGSHYSTKAETSTQTTDKATSCPSTSTVPPTLPTAALSVPSSTTIGNEESKPNTTTEPLQSKLNTTTEPLQSKLNTTTSSFPSSPGAVVSSSTEPSVSSVSTGSSTSELVTTFTLPLTMSARGNARADFSGLTSLSTQTENETSSFAFPTEQPQNNLTMLAFGVMSLILILIVVMVILVTVVNLRGKCHRSKESKGKKSGDSGVSESNSANLEKESITLVSVKSLNIETDSPRICSTRRTTIENDEHGGNFHDVHSTKLV
ncbi:endothelial cell-specific chemotaxis regulator-like isoform X3 [Acipenser ruthenus]|uniref:endothelial cell-specific chemotaxis regulator-like isoform X3 n=1 Tax=Acipenser ruthenus TaxID=7906 RepID=UPI00145C0E12|nr:endothelial cell-specific chemotaxis regulator-like isoform X3 [Acipenser ruthenus]